MSRETTCLMQSSKHLSSGATVGTPLLGGTGYFLLWPSMLALQEKGDEIECEV